MTKYELRDTNHPTWKGQFFSSLVRAEKALAESVPPGRFILIDRTPAAHECSGCTDCTNYWAVGFGEGEQLALRQSADWPAPVAATKRDDAWSPWSSVPRHEFKLDPWPA